MTKNIAHKTITVNGEPSPCECNDEIACGYCVQANLVLWERDIHPKQTRDRNKIQEMMVETVRRMRDKDEVAGRIGVNRHTVYKWLKNKKIPPKYYARIYEKVGYPTGV